METGTRLLPSVPVFLGDDGPYQFTPRKMALVAHDIRTVTIHLLDGKQDVTDEAVARQDRWLALGFGAEQWAKITARRADPDDPLEQEHINLMYATLVREGVRMLRQNRE